MSPHWRLKDRQLVIEDLSLLRVVGKGQLFSPEPSRTCV